MRTVILTCNTGEGHNSASAAIKEVYDKHNEKCQIADTLSFLSEKASGFICNWHSRIYRYIPKAFTKGYEYAEGHPSLFEERSAVYKMITAGAERLNRYLEEGKYDTVICAHVFSSLLMSAVLKKYSPDVRTCFVATDYTCSPSTANNLDLYFIPDQALSSEYEENGIDKSRIIGVGVPVKQKFLALGDEAKAKEEVSIEPGKRHILVMCGSMGCGPMDELAYEISQAVGDNVVITVVCGTNKRLYNRLARRFSDVDNVRILGYVNNIPTLMDSADIFLTKPGGVSVSEAASKRLPMVFVDAVAGCEEHNMRFYLDRGMAVTADTPRELAKLCKELVSDEEKLKEIKANIESNVKDDPAEKIYRTLLKLSEEVIK